MDITSLLSLTTVFCNQESTSKKRVLEDISEHVGDAFPDLNPNTIFRALISREKLGSTGIGNGIAIPHCRLAECKDITTMLITLRQGIDFDAIDNEKVDVIFVLIVPEDANDNHLKTLASIAEKLSDETILFNIRQAQDTQTLLNALA
jgi:PTS system nitrogen regulatory IIA component